MNHFAITIVKWMFVAVGIVMLAGALVFRSGVGTLVLAFLGLVFTTIGGGVIGYGLWATKKENFLRQHGHLVQADLQQVEVNQALEVNGANPFRIVAQWHDAKNNELFIFRSANLWFDPSKFVQGRKIPVYVDLSKPSRYYVDISFLPKVRG
jgi:hypothetical protein